ncbi:MAG: endonuclease [Cyclobacteriaceae bacterium]|nr:endonuclease [Cyclobacteriaceae bacterium]
MPEGPSILIAKEKLSELKGKKIISVTGDAKIDMVRIIGNRITDLKSWGKHFLICFPKFFLRIHFMMFGTYRLNERKAAHPRLRLAYKEGEVNFYTCIITLHEGLPADFYDWEKDIMSHQWNSRKAKNSLKILDKAMVCDVLLDQSIFSGVGNIIKNESLFRARIHPESRVGALPPVKVTAMIKEAHDYSFDFYRWKKINELSKHFLVYEKSDCPRCKIPLVKKYIGKGKRLTCFCSNCQILYR